jgi:hypothetical protein
MYGDLTSDSLIYGRLFDGDNNGILGYVIAGFMTI